MLYNARYQIASSELMECQTGLEKILMDAFKLHDKEEIYQLPLSKVELILFDLK